MKSTILLKNAVREDSRELAKLSIMAGGNFFPFAFGRNAEAILSKGFRSTNTLTSYQKAQVVCVHDEIAGMVVGFTEVEQHSELSETEKLLGKLLGVRGLWVLVVMFFMPDFFGKAQPGEFYLYSIAVFPKYRGQGLGKILLEAVELKAKKQGFNTISLDVNGENTRAITFYKQAGYRIVDQVTPKLFRSTLGVVCRMEKQIYP
ncbi:MAG: GNAT family N-acetyltransferase [Deltaproteobacteria bacterium]|nr:GNAT family N-acetyltransferase [Deltaproteobacteria bacterium]